MKTVLGALDELARAVAALAERVTAVERLASDSQIALLHTQQIATGIRDLITTPEPVTGTP